MILSILYLLFYAAAGVLIGRYLFSTESFPRRLWLGLTLGLFGSIWLPSLFSFVLGFGTVSHTFTFDELFAIVEVRDLVGVPAKREQFVVGTYLLDIATVW